MADKTNGCFDDGGFRIEVRAVSQKGTCDFCHQKEVEYVI